MAARFVTEPSMINLIPSGVDALEQRLAGRPGRTTLITVTRLEDRYKGCDVVLGRSAASSGEADRVDFVGWTDLAPTRPRPMRSSSRPSTGVPTCSLV
jgi:hypothetical protein